MNIQKVAEYGYERPVMESEQLAVGKWGTLWYVIDMVASHDIGRPSHIGTPVPERWRAVEQVESYVRRGQYQ